jgi:hypothetical protein
MGTSRQAGSENQTLGQQGQGGVLMSFRYLRRNPNDAPESGLNP